MKHDELDLDGLSPQDARSYVARYCAALSEARTRKAAARKEFERWERRVQLAHAAGDSELAAAALARAESATTTYEQARSDEHELSVTCDLLKQRLETLLRKPGLTIDADALLSHMNSVLNTDTDL